MGGVISNSKDLVLVSQTLYFLKAWHIDDVQFMLKRFKNELGSPFTLTEDHFCRLLHIDTDVGSELYIQVFDQSARGSIDSFEVITAAILLATASIDEKIDQIFRVYDYADNNMLTHDEVAMLLRTAIHSASKIDTQAGVIDNQKIVQFTRELYQELEKAVDNDVTIEEFHILCYKNEYLKNFCQYWTKEKQNTMADAKFEDLDFHPKVAVESSLLHESTIKWLRPAAFSSHSALFGTYPYKLLNILPGVLSHIDCIYAIAFVASRSNFIQNCISSNMNGEFSAVLFVDGKRKFVRIDTRLPFDSLGAPLGCHVDGLTEHWMMMLEKAIAKTVGSYASIFAHSYSYFVHLLTGGILCGKDSISIHQSGSFSMKDTDTLVEPKFINQHNLLNDVDKKIFNSKHGNFESFELNSVAGNPLWAESKTNAFSARTPFEAKLQYSWQFFFIVDTDTTICTSLELLNSSTDTFLGVIKHTIVVGEVLEKNHNMRKPIINYEELKIVSKFVHCHGSFIGKNDVLHPGTYVIICIRQNDDAYISTRLVLYSSTKKLPLHCVAPQRTLSNVGVNSYSGINFQFKSSVQPTHDAKLVQYCHMFSDGLRMKNSIP